MTTPILELQALFARYGPVGVLHGVDLEVREGEIVVLLGANGAGKTTLMRAVSGLVSCSDSVRIDGRTTLHWPRARLARERIAHVPEGRGTFAELSVEDNLRIGAYSRRDQAAIESDINRWMDLFPVLRERRDQLAGLLSGGEQQMLAVSRALMARPRLIMIDEPSLGLAPIITAELFRQLAGIRAELGTAMLLVEQNAQLALSIADRGYVLSSGYIVTSGSTAELRDDEKVRLAYLGR